LRIFKDPHIFQQTLLCSSGGASGSSKIGELDLPERWKHVLLSAFIASWNPAKTDHRMVAAVYDRSVRRKKGGAFRKTANTSSKSSTASSGAHKFPLERLLSIYHSIFALYDGEETHLVSKGLLPEVCVCSDHTHGWWHS
jgi:hypothetical protein